MMIVLIILAYVASVFLNRWLNFLVIKTSSHYPITPALWFLPIAFTFAMLSILWIDSESTWFTGKNWKKK